MTIYDNENVTYKMTDQEIITSSHFKELINDPFRTIEGAYITYQISNIKIYKGIFTPEVDVPSPVLNNFYFNTANRSEYRYDGSDWIRLTEPMLDTLVETGFSAAWVPVTTVQRAEGLEILLPSNYLPLNADQSVNLFIGFQDIVNSSDVVSALGIPLVDSNGNRILDKEDNTSIYLPMKLQCGLVPTILESHVKTLEGNLQFRDSPDVNDIISFYAEYDSYSSDRSSYGLGNLLGTSLNF